MGYSLLDVDIDGRRAPVDEYRCRAAGEVEAGIRIRFGAESAHEFARARSVG
jgi:hypothetical protein